MSRRPKWVVFIAAALAIASVAHTARHLTFESDRNKLISPDISWNKRYLSFSKIFPSNNQLVIVVDSVAPRNPRPRKDGTAASAAARAAAPTNVKPPIPKGQPVAPTATTQPSPKLEAQAMDLVNHLGVQLRRSKLVDKVIWRFKSTEVSPKAIRLEPLPQFKKDLARLAQSKVLLSSPTPSALIAQSAGEMRASLQPSASPQGATTQPAGNPSDQINEAAQGLGLFQGLIDSFTKRLQTPAAQPVDLMAYTGAALGTNVWHYLRTDNQRFFLIEITPKGNPGAISEYADAITMVRHLLDQARQNPSYHDLSFGLTGGEVINADETQSAISDSTMTTVIAFVVIAILLIIAFHSFRTPLLLMISLLIGIGWSFGFVTVAVGHLQIISVIFTVMLLGLGVGYGIYIASRFELIRHDYPDTEEGFADALRDTMMTVGPGVITGAVTTAAAFCTTMFTDFRGVAEMGEIAGVGVILCLIAMCSVFPALLRIFKPRHKHLVRMEDRYIHIFEERWITPFFRHPRLTLTMAALITLASFAGIAQMRFNYNLLDLLPQGLKSVNWAQRLEHQGNQPSWSAVSVVDNMDQARTLAKKLRALKNPDGSPMIKSFGGVGLLIPEDGEEKLKLLAQARADLAPALARVLPRYEGRSRGAEGPRGQGTKGGRNQGEASSPPHLVTPSPSHESNLVSQLTTLSFALRFALPTAPASLQPTLRNLQAAMSRFSAAASALTPQQLTKRLDALQHDYQRWQKQIATTLAAAVDPSPLGLGTMPEKLIAPYVAHLPDGQTRLMLEIYPNTPKGVRDPLVPSFLSRFVHQVEQKDPNVTGGMVQVYESGHLIWTSYIKAGIYALIAVFLIVLIDLRTPRDAALVLIPVAVGFAVCFAVMYLAGQQINPANIIVLPLMFGIGVDIGVQVIYRYRADPKRRPLGLTAGTGKGITLNSYTIMIGFGSLMLGHHRGVASLGFVLCVGIGLTMLACWTIMPAWLELRARRAAKLATDEHG